jgi:thiamine biosynthesis lipoprotein
MHKTAVYAMPVAARRIEIEHVMGTVVSIDVRDADVADSAIKAAFEGLAEVDRRFSPFKPESEISRLARGELTIEDCHRDVATVLDLCEDLRMQTGGAFNAWRARADGRLDPSGVVKGWAVDRAADILDAAGARNFAINAGGDVVVRGEPEAGRQWRIGLRHPHDTQVVSAVIEVGGMAVATSGRYERGDHILDARSGEPSRELLSLTVAGARMTLADAFATAGFAMGTPGIAWIQAQPGYSVYAITAGGAVRFCDGFARLFERRRVGRDERGAEHSAA